MKKADIISRSLQNWVRTSGYDIIIPNFYWGRYEMDLFLMKPSGFVYEYEIKISRSDFFNDFKKPQKHDRFRCKNSDSNRFFFVVPSGLVSTSEVPAYAGLIYANFSKGVYGDRAYFNIEKNAPLIHKNKKNDGAAYRSLAQSLAFREQIYRQKYNRLKNS